MTDANGESRAVWTLGFFTAPQAARAELEPLAAIEFTATATPGAPAFVDVSPGFARIGIGDTVPFQVSVKDAFLNVVPDQTVTWSSADASVADVDTAGAVEGISGGPVPIVASLDNLADTAFVTVEWGVTILFDIGHNNSGTTPTGADWITGTPVSDGYDLALLDAEITPDVLAGGQILWVLHPIRLDSDTLSAFTGSEITAITDWVQAGGALFYLLERGDGDFRSPWQVRDLGPVDLASAFGIDLRLGFAWDQTQFSIDEFGTRSERCLRENEVQMFRRSDGSLTDHPVTRGRSATERIDSVGTWMGSAMQPDANGAGLMVFGPNAMIVEPDSVNFNGWDFTGAPRTAINGWFQGVARDYGTGRVVVIGEAHMFGGGYCPGPNWTPRFEVGLASPKGQQNRQFLLNIFHWLSGALN